MMPTHDEELAVINEKLAKLQHKHYIDYAHSHKIASQIVKMKSNGLKKTKKNLESKRKNLSLKLEGRRAEDNKKKLHNVDFLIKSIDEALTKDEADTSSEDEESEENHKNEDIKRKVVKGETLADGNCFYSAIYRSARDYPKGDLRSQIYNELTSKKVESINEYTFIKDIRNSIADKIEGGIYDEIDDGSFFESLMESANGIGANGLGENGIGAKFSEWHESSARQIHKKIKSNEAFIKNYSDSEGKVKFYIDIADIIRQNGVYASQSDILVVDFLLEKINIKLIKISSKPPNPYLEDGDNKVVWLYRAPNPPPGLEHYEYWKFVEGAGNQNEEGENEQEERKENNKEQKEDVSELDPCARLYDPCSGVIITEENPLKVIQKKIAALQRSKRLEKDKIVPKELREGTRLDLLLWVLNNESFSNIENLNEENLLNYKTESGTSYSPDLFESYWDILLALGFIEGFERKSNRYMYNGKVEELERIPLLDKGSEGDFIADPFSYLKGTHSNKKAIKTSNIGGASDITLFYKSTKSKIPKADPCSFEEANLEVEKSDKPKFVFVSCKKFLKEKSIDKYDIMNIYGAAKKIPQDEINKEIVLMVVNDEDVKKVKEGASRKYISEEASSVFGKSTMIASLRKIYEFASQIERPITEIKLRKLFEDRKEEAMGGEEIADDRKIEPLNLLLHQRMTVRFIANAIREFHKKPTRKNRFLIGILPRGGKTFIAGGLITELKVNNIVVLLGAKSETQSQFIDELFYKYLNFNEYKIINVKDEKDPELKKGDLDVKSKHIFVMSIELFKMEEALIENRPLLKLLRGLLPGKKSPIDLFISDEAHLKQATQKAEKAVEEAVYDEIDADAFADAKFKSIPIVYMTGTFIKPKLAFSIPDEHIMTWDYEDVQRAKTLDENLDYFNNSFGDYFKEALQYILLTTPNSSVDSIKKTYQSFPEIHLIESHFFPDVEDRLLTQGSDKGIPDMTKLFIIDQTHNFKVPNNWHLGLQFQKFMRRLVNFVSPSDSQVNQEEDKMTSAMTSIDRIAQRTGDRLKMVTSDFVVHSQLWFMPRMVGNPLGKRIMALTGTIMQNPWFRKNFNVFAVSGVDWKTYLSDVRHVESGVIDIEVGSEKGRFQYDISSSKSLKERVLDAEEKARKENKGLIILAQNMLQLGISLPCVSIVVLLDSGTDNDERTQKKYRALTQSPQKKDAFIIDLNYFRTIQAIVAYQIATFKVRHKRDPAKEDKRSIINDIFNIYSINDEKNLFQAKEGRDIEIDKILSKLQEKEYRQPTDLKDGGQMINNNISDTVNIDIGLLSYLEPHKESDRKVKKELLKKMELRLKKAKALKENDNDENDSKEQIDESKKNKDDRISREIAYLEIFKTLLRYGVFATENKTLVELKDNIKGDSDTQDKIYDMLLKRSLIKETLSKEILINKIILPNLNKLLENKKGQSFIAMKGYVNDDSKYPTQVQEVLHYINDHLAPKDAERLKYGEVFTPLELIDEMLSKIPEEKWKDPELRWLDPANGIGNFPLKALLGQQSGQYTYLGLFEGLREKMPDDNKRYKHIIENMLFMIDINQKNNSIARKLFKKISPESTSNIEQIDKDKGCLVDRPYAFNGKRISSFDIIIGNPPFQDDPTEKPEGIKYKKTYKNVNLKAKKITRKAPRKGGKNKLYERITSKCLDLLNKDGILYFITPDNVFSGNVLDVYNKMLRKNVELINLNSISSRYFKGVGQSMCYFMVLNNDNYKATLIISETGEFRTKLKNRSVNPIKEWNKETEKLIETYISEEKNTFEYYRGKSADDYKGGDIEVIYTIDGEKLRTNDVSLAPGKGKKLKIVLFEAKPRSEPFYDKEGKYGVGPHTFYYVCKTDNDAKKILKFFESDEYKKLLDLILTSQFLKAGLLKNLNIDYIINQ